MSEDTLTALESGSQLLRAGDLDAARAQLQTAAREDPSSAPAHNLLGICQSRQGQHAEAARNLRRAAELAPDDPAMHYNLAVVLEKSGRADSARGSVERALQLKPDHAQAAALQRRLQPAEAAPPPPAADIGLRAGADAPIAFPALPEEAAAEVIAEPAAPPGIGFRIRAGLVWGALIAQWWTALLVFWEFVWRGMPKGGVAPILVVAAVFVVVFAVIGGLIGLIVGAANLEPEAAAWIGVGAGMLLMGLEFLISGNAFSFVNVIFWFFTGRYVGRAIGWRVQKAVRT